MQRKRSACIKINPPTLWSSIHCKVKMRVVNTSSKQSPLYKSPRIMNTKTTTPKHNIKFWTTIENHRSILPQANNLRLHRAVINHRVLSRGTLPNMCDSKLAATVKHECGIFITHFPAMITSKQVMTAVMAEVCPAL